MSKKKRQRSEVFKLRTLGDIIIDSRDHDDNPLRQIMPDVSSYTVGKFFGDRLLDVVEYKKQRKNTWCVGLAWNQVIFSVEEPARVLIVRAAKDAPYLTYVNPYIESMYGRRYVNIELCDSLPGKRKKVLRYERIRIRFLGPDETVHYATFRDEGAAFLQHEVDHLDGILMTDDSRKLIPFRKEAN